MLRDLPDPKELGLMYALAQIGLEMVAPIGVGLALDFYLGWTPWLTVVGVILGFVGGLMHLFVLLNRQEKAESAKRRRDGQ